ncbi:DUF5522 domain-containing protein [Cyclobacterium lianum]|uniref:DUF5522 domain-containing protein n=1 Tax=Cyclobacterium lianum TaxID=388280 RepID=UPI000932DE91|nr:DUF5522 domain-containing protein [Cyclobacterium lianum]
MSVKKRLPAPHLLEEGIHFYYEGPLIVFTETYHLLRGYCCGSGCRHCPYRKVRRSGNGSI